MLQPGRLVRQPFPGLVRTATGNIRPSSRHATRRAWACPTGQWPRRGLIGNARPARQGPRQIRHPGHNALSLEGL